MIDLLSRRAEDQNLFKNIYGKVYKCRYLHILKLSQMNSPKSLIEFLFLMLLNHTLK